MIQKFPPQYHENIDAVFGRAQAVPLALYSFCIVYIKVLYRFYAENIAKEFRCRCSEGQNLRVCEVGTSGCEFLQN